MKIGFIDYFIDEWHANNYPIWLKDATNGEMEVAYAYGMIDHPEGGLTTDAWCEKFGVTRCQSIQELVEKSDAIVVLSPNDCQMHEALCQVPLRSGKPVYVDKTFSPDVASGRRIFDLAAAHGTPCYSSSALRFAEEYAAIDRAHIRALASVGGNSPEIYMIHQLEPVMMLMQTPAKRVMGMENDEFYTLTVEFDDKRIATITNFKRGMGFSISAAYDNAPAQVYAAEKDFFQPFIVALADFFRTGVIPVQPEETLRIMAVREASMKALAAPGQWVEV